MNLPILIGCFVVLVFWGSFAHGHTTEELEQEFGEVPESLVNITATYERAVKEANPLSSRLHATQHEMLLEYQCLKLLANIPALERQIQKLEEAGKDSETAHGILDKAKAFTSMNCSQPPR